VKQRRVRAVARPQVMQRQIAFWVGAFILFGLALWLLSEILLPFVAGMGIAYLLTPLVDRIERQGVNRLLAALLVVALVILGFVAIILLAAPVIGSQLGAFIDNIPRYFARIQAVLADPQSPWLQKLVGQGFGNDKSFGDLIAQGVGWLTAFLRSLWSGGRALVSVFSLVVVTPVVAFYLVYDWHRMIAKVDGWVPVHHRATVRRLAREIDLAIAGFVRGQTAVCLILGSFYAVALTLTGLNFGFLIGLVSGLNDQHRQRGADDARRYRRTRDEPGCACAGPAGGGAGDAVGLRNLRRAGRSDADRAHALGRRHACCCVLSCL